ncbi:MAG TPA: hypothetical protein VLJ42_07905 [Solirubrobacteraceae bacterium]|nr:hypothetical protein [Solirubrobacteraceae bacterium]
MTSASIPTTPPSPSPEPEPRVRITGAGEQELELERETRRRLGRWAPSPTLARRELVWAALGAIVLAILTSWPLVLHLPSRIAPDLGDPVRTAWQVAWVGHGMLHDPLNLFDANAFYPRPLSLAFSDSLLGYGPAAFFGSGTVAALVRYNLLFLFAWSLCFLGAYLLVRELGAGRLGAVVAGVAFAYAPYRVTEAGHLHVISSGGIPLALFLLLRGYRRGSRVLVLAGWLVSAWQISLGFTLGLQYSYLLAALAALAVWHWWRQGRPALPRRLVAITCAGIAVLGVVTIYEARPYLKISQDYPSARRTIRQVKTYSSGPAAFLSASSENRVWGAATASMRDHVHSKNESVLFPGLAIFVLAILGLCAPLYTRRLRIGLAAGVLVCSVLALGMGLTGAGYPYRLMYDFAPGWDGVRVPGRVFTMATLFLALLAGAGASWLLTWVRARSAAAAPRVRDGLPALVSCVLVVGLVGEGAGHMAHPLVPQPARAEIGLRGPLLDLPTDGASDRVWQYFSTNGFPQIAQGNSTFDIPSLDDLRGGLNRFPDRASVEKVRYYGIRTIVLHTKLPKLPGLHGYSISEPPNVKQAAARPIAGLGVKRRDFDGGVIYEIGPGPKALHGTN